MDGYDYNRWVKKIVKISVGVFITMLLCLVLLSIYHFQTINRIIYEQRNDTTSLYKENDHVRLNNAFWKVQKVEYVAGKYKYLLKYKDHELTLDEYTLKKFQNGQKR